MPIFERQAMGVPLGMPMISMPSLLCQHFYVKYVWIPDKWCVGVCTIVRSQNCCFKLSFRQRFSNHFVSVSLLNRFHKSVVQKLSTLSSSHLKKRKHIRDLSSSLSLFLKLNLFAIDHLSEVVRKAFELVINEQEEDGVSTKASWVMFQKQERRGTGTTVPTQSRDS